MILRKAMRPFCCVAMLALPLIFTACGLRDDNLESASGGKDNQVRKESGEISGEQGESGFPGGGKGTGEAGNVSAPGGKLAAADFYYMPMKNDIVQNSFYKYAVNGEYLYFEDIGENVEGRGPVTTVVRKRISDGNQEDIYIISEKSRTESMLKVFLADSAGNCYLLWGPGTMEEVAVSGYSLEKYGPEGELLWHTDHTPEELEGMGELLQQGAVTEGGRVFLYSYGGQGRVFAFSGQGELEEAYTPELEALEGIAVGKDGQAYGYCITGKDPLFVELGGGGNAYVCPLVPLQVYDTHGDGICLRTGDGMWGYEPVTGETEMLWGWSDEYVQIDGKFVHSVFSGDSGYMLLCLEQGKPDPDVRPVYTFALIRSVDSGEYPGKQVLSLATAFRDTRLDQVVRLYNRHSKKYRVEVEEKSRPSLEMELVQGAAPDLIDIGHIYAGNLAGQGAFEDLGSWFENNQAVDREDILEPVREACTINGKEVGVIPSFTFGIFQAEEPWCLPEEWTVWKFLETGRECRLFQTQGPEEAFQYCMGIRYGEHFIDWETRKCHFDSDEFRRILEGCRQWKDYERGRGGTGEKDWLLEELVKGIDSVYGVMQDGEPEYGARLVGYPGWKGAEYRLRANGMFAINSFSQNKEGAWDFLEYLLSDEYQSLVEGAFPARKEYFEEYVRNPYRPAWMEMVVDSETGLPLATPGEKELSLLTDMLDAAVFDTESGYSNPVRDIVSEEAGMYFQGDAALDETVDKIQNRVQTWLDER